MSSSDDKTLLNDCGCCETDSLEYQQHYNRPGQNEIKYRLDSHSGFLLRNLQRLSRDQLPEQKNSDLRRPLFKLTTRSNDDPSIALLDSWAMVVDVLAFYQERIANEGFLRTATERRSILELAREIGYELNPGVAASTYLVFDADNSIGSPATAIVAKGTQVLSIPGKDEVPQTFETTEQIIARAEWNQLKPYTKIDSVSDKITSGVVKIRLDGIATGLKPGDGILFVGENSVHAVTNRYWDFRILTKVEVATDNSNTQISWQHALVISGAASISSTIQMYSFAVRSSIFGQNAADWRDLPDSIKDDYLTDNLGSISNVAVTRNGSHMVFAANNNAVSLWSYVQASRNWTKQHIDSGSNGVISCVAVASSGLVIALGLTDGSINLLLKNTATSDWVSKPIPKTGVAHNAEVSQIAFSKDGDNLISLDIENTRKVWDSRNRDFVKNFTPRNSVTLISGISYRIASDDRSLIVWTFSGSWNSTTISLTAHKQAISSVALSRNGNRVVSASIDGSLKVWLKSATTGIWSSFTLATRNSTLAHKSAITSVSFSNDGREVVSSSVDGVTRRWRMSNRSLLNTFDNDTVDNLSQWPEFDVPSDINNPQLILNDKYPGLAQNSWMVLNQASSTELYLINEINNSWYSKFNISIDVAQLSLDSATHLSWFDRRDTEVFAQSSELQLYREQRPRKLPIEGIEYELDQLAPELEADRMVVVTGKRMRARIILADSVSPSSMNETQNVTCPGLTLTSSDGFTTECLFNNDSLIVMAQPKPFKEGFGIWWRASEAGFKPVIFELKTKTKASSDLEIIWLLQDRNGFIGTVTTATENILLTAPLQDDTDTSEVVLINELLEKTHNQRLIVNSLIRFQSALTNIYDFDSVSLNANVAPATHGETVGHQVLGSGNGTSINQEFVLNKNPLTYVSAATVTGGESSLEVRVNDVLWQQVSSLYNEGIRSQAYIIRHDNDGNSIITFGDGKQGARLPTGQENISARYRTGIGAEGEVNAQTLRLLKSKPLGIREVTNPLAATGAAAAEVLEDARANAPLTVLTLDRIVSVQDFEDFAAAFAGIGKAQASVLWNGETNVMHITTATASGESLTDNSILYRNLLVGLNRVRDTTVIVLMNGYEEMRFKIEASLVIDPLYLRDKVEANVRVALQSAFTFEQRSFGQGVTEVEVLTIILGIEGVIAAELTGTKLQITKGTANPEFQGLNMKHLRAKKAYWDVNQSKAHAGQLLMLNPATAGIEFKELAS